MATSQLSDLYADAKLTGKKHARSTLVMLVVYFAILAIIALLLR